MRWLGVVATAFVFLVIPSSAAALEPRDVFVIYNKNVKESLAVAQHYCQKRGVPAANLIALDLPDIDEIAREDFNHRVLTPLHAALEPHRDQAKVLLTVYGVPLRVGPQTPSVSDKEMLAKLDPLIKQAQTEKDKLVQAIRVIEDELRAHPNSPLANSLPTKRKERQDAERNLQQLQQERMKFAHPESQAALDSELMLLWRWPDYPLYRFVENPLYWCYSDAYRRKFPPVLMTARLDGPTPEIAKRLVDDAVAAEQTGLAGKVYVDARGIHFNPESDPSGTGYGGYDESFREMAALLDKTAKMNVTLDDQEPLFPVGRCSDCALYCGWYALMNYTPCCKFVPGAVAWHLASAEAVSLRTPGKQWAGNLLRDGAAATIGPVAEPYTGGFPPPEEFFGFLVTGRYTLVECYARTTMLTSWMMVLVGDPLYNPYGKTPKLAPEQVLPSPKRAIKINPGGSE
jgi:uncharacterized protein (TIGR03790 family)